MIFAVLFVNIYQLHCVYYKLKLLTMTTLELNGNKLEFDCVSDMVVDEHGKKRFFAITIGGISSINRSMGESAMCELTHMLITGIPEGYNDSIEDYMSEWHTSWPWDKLNRELAEIHVKTRPYFPIVKAEFKKKFEESKWFETTSQ